MRSCLFNVDFERSENSGPLPSIQVFGFSDNLNLIGYSDYHKSEDCILAGSVRIQQGQVSIAIDSLLSDVEYIPIIIRVPSEGSVFESARNCIFKCEVLNDFFQSEKLSLQDGGTVDWMVLGVLVFRRKEDNLTVSRVELKDVSSFPERHGDVIHQLKNLIESISEESSTSDGWCTLFVANTDSESSSPRTVASASPKQNGTITFAPGSPLIKCRDCHLKDLEISTLKYSLEQKDAEIRKATESGAGRSPRTNQTISELSMELERLREKERETLLTIDKQNILIDRLRVERRSNLHEELLGDAISMSNKDIKTVGLKTNLDLAVQLVQQEELVIAIKEQLSKLVHQSKNVYRLRELNSTK